MALEGEPKSSASSSRNHFGFGAPSTSTSTRIGIPKSPDSSQSSKRSSFHFRFDDDNHTVVLSNDPKTIILTNAQSSATETTSLLAREAATNMLPKLTGDETRSYFRRLGIVENITILEMDRDHFLKEEGIQELGRGGEGAVYFTHGHVVKVVEPNYARAALREIVHILYLNPLKKQEEGLMSTRFREDFPTLIWIYVLNDGALAIGMEPFDKGSERGGTLEQRLKSGPPIRGDYLVRLLLGLSRSLAHVHSMGIIHHDLKPANIYLPADKMKPPIVFDLGQALWSKSAWGKEWLRNEHNAAYWYNGSFRYMHWSRRRAHLAALHALQGKPFEPRHIAALQGYIPSYYADVFAFGRILRDISNSPFHKMNEKECSDLRDLARRILGLHPPAQQKRFSSKFLPIVLGLRNKSNGPNVAEIYATMDKVIPEVEKVLNRFELVL